MKRLAGRISLLLLSILFILGITSGPAFAQVRFPDVADDFWAAKYIVKMDLRGVVDGYPDGSFKPGDNVTEEEALKMAVYNAGLQGEVEIADELLYLPFDVSDWARKVAIVAVGKGFIVPEENNFVAKRDAGRAWVAQMMVRIIDKEGEAIAAANDALNFTDTAQIPSWARGHIAVAVKYGLVEGYPDGSFGPKDPIKRSEMATMLTRTEKFLSVPGLISGTITDISGTSVTVKDANGRSEEYMLVYPYHLYDQKGQIDRTSLQRYSRVSLYAEGKNAKFIEVLGEDTVARNLRGEIVQLYLEENWLVLQDGEQLRSVELAENVSVTLYGGFSGGLDDLSRGNTVDIELNEFNRAVTVQVLEGISEAGNVGIIHDIDHEVNLVTIKVNNQLRPYRFDNSLVVEISNRLFAGIEDIKAGDRVRISAKNEYIEKITLLEAGAELILSGTAVMIDTNKRLFVLEEKDGLPKIYKVDNNVKVTISGETVHGLASIVEGDMVRVEIKKDIITAIEVKNREVDSLATGTVVGIDPNNLVITVKDRDGELHAYEINEIAEYYIDDRRVDLEDFKKDMKVEVQLVLGKVIYLESRNIIEGTVEQISDTRKVLVFKESGGETQTLILDNKVRVNIEDEKADIDDVRKGDLVEIRIEDGKVVIINVEKVLTYVVKDIVKSSDRLKVEDDYKDSKNLYIRSYVDLIIEGVNKPKTGDVKKGDIVRATYMGSRLVKVEVLPVLSGKVISVSTPNNVVTVELFEGTTRNITFSDKSKVVTDGKTYYHLSDLTAGDRVQVRDSVDGGKIFYVMGKASGRFYSVNDSRDKIFTQKNPVEWDSYTLYEDVYLHQRGTNISFRNLEVNDYVTLYLLDNVVYEIEKQ
ncbi:MAG TPA: S-layer homology domain-containing protein [Clostridia bacterium]|nr:S-layer homology domain-containing protein [Clostridia bacterium]